MIERCGCIITKTPPLQWNRFTGRQYERVVLRHKLRTYNSNCNYVLFCHKLPPLHNQCMKLKLIISILMPINVTNILCIMNYLHYHDHHHHHHVHY